jgi:Galactosyltransferase
MTISNRRHTPESSRLSRVDSLNISSVTGHNTSSLQPTRKLFSAQRLWWLLHNNYRRTVIFAAVVLLIAGIFLLDHSTGLAKSVSWPTGFEQSGSASRLLRARDLIVAQQAKPSLLSSDTKNNVGEMIILVLSAASNGKRRDAIRETWGRAPALHPEYEAYYVVRFVVGIDSTDNNLVVEAESRLHEDLLIVPVEETYENLPRKLYESIRWAVQQENNSDNDTRIAHKVSAVTKQKNWIIKADDDMYLRPNVLYNRLLTTLNARTPIVLGCILQDEPVRNTGKWQERTFPGPIYPTFPQGSCGYVLSWPVATFVARKGVTTAGGLTYYHGEDTSLGIWLSSWHDTDEVTKDDDETGIQWIHAPAHFVNNGQCEGNNTNAFIIGHKITPEHMKQCYAADFSSTAVSAAANTDELESISFMSVGSSALAAKTTSGPGHNEPPNRPKKDSEEYQTAMARYEQNQRATAREREDEERRVARERRRHEQLLGPVTRSGTGSH